ncbi:peptidylprolyl isomerase [Aureibaculum sp. 2210JD6-5]|uniref:peptidylprolyl isomerase n=1 Tax=Aureibaculum sp. 2210JD6-5 TaxID=3103957 RepID=UPI002AAD84FE|nr:peptidylprolyl isomerase [Aureibaculum sp. 2210JD6-5]MDY7396583.1 peptidylprolyl isomerase [Aureibaculum sp. 2210JD6-5]
MKPFFYTILIFLILVSSACGKKIIKEKWLKKEAPAVFKARFETTKGNFDIEAHREWSPKAVDRLYQLISTDFYTHIALYRVVPNFVAQFGIHDNSDLNKAWNSYKIPDEPVKKSNAEGTIAFARGGPKSRSTQLFINLKNNARLDSIFYSDVTGFPVIAKVTDGMDVVKTFYDDYGENPGRKQDSIQKYGNSYLKSTFPKLDYIKKAYIVK